MAEAVIVDAIRTPIGRAVKGSLRGMRADELAAVPIAELMRRNPGVDFSQTTDVLMGAAGSLVFTAPAGTTSKRRTSPTARARWLA